MAESPRFSFLEPDGSFRLTPDELHRFKVDVLGWSCDETCPGNCMKAAHQLVAVAVSTRRPIRGLLEGEAV